jgi:hypothetical protein
MEETISEFFEKYGLKMKLLQREKYNGENYSCLLLLIVGRKRRQNC